MACPLFVWGSVRLPDVSHDVFFYDGGMNDVIREA